MSRPVIINGKEYIQSTALASSCGYSSDYISKLAREEKVLGTQIGRQWFIEPESLKSFLYSISVAQEIRKTELSKQRKLEQTGLQNNETTPLQTKFFKRSSFFVALGESTAVMACGILVGSLLWVAQSNGVTTGDLSGALAMNAQFILTSLSSPTSNSQPLIRTLPQSNEASAQASVAQNSIGNGNQPESEIFATLPQFSKRGTTTSLTSSMHGSLSSAVGTQTSQVPFEVEVTEDEHGKELIQPIQNNASSSGAVYLLVPVNRTKI